MKSKKSSVHRALPKGKRKKGYLKDFNNIKKDLSAAIAEIGHFPTAQELGKRDSSLLTALVRYHKGIPAVRERLGYQQGKRSNGYYQSPYNLRKELETIMEEVGGFPTYSQISERNSGLAFGLQYHGGLSTVRTWYNSAPLHKIWSTKIIRKEMNSLIEKIGQFPTQEELNKLNCPLQGAIARYGGINKVRTWYGLSPLQKEKGYWKNPENLHREFKQIIKKRGHFPLFAEIKEDNYALLQAITRYYGGINELRKQYGESFVRKPKKYWQNLNHVRQELQTVIEEVGHFPKAQEIVRLNSGLLHALQRYHGGLEKFKVARGYAQRELEVIQTVVKDETYSGGN